MRKRNLILLGFAAVVAAQLAVPAWMIIEREQTLRKGFVFKFKTRPFDPVDAFRGRYVRMRLEPEMAKVPDAGQWRYRQKAFAVLGTDTNGFAVVKRLERAAPGDEPAVPVHTSWFDEKKREVHLEWSGLDRYYMEENRAPDAEAAYARHSIRTNRTCHVTVRVRGAHAVVENLFIEDQPIRAWLREHPAKGR